MGKLLMHPKRMKASGEGLEGERKVHKTFACACGCKRRLTHGLRIPRHGYVINVHPDRVDCQRRYLTTLLQRSGFSPDLASCKDKKALQGKLDNRVEMIVTREWSAAQSDAKKMTQLAQKLLDLLDISMLIGQRKLNVNHALEYAAIPIETQNAIIRTYQQEIVKRAA